MVSFQVRLKNIVMSSDNIVDIASRIVTELKTRFKLDVVTIILTSDDEGGPGQGRIARAIKSRCRKCLYRQ